MKKADLTLGAEVAIKNGSYAEPQRAIVLTLDPWNSRTYVARRDDKETFTLSDGTEVVVPRSIYYPDPKGRKVLVAVQGGWGSVWSPKVVTLNAILGPYAEAIAAHNAAKQREYDARARSLQQQKEGYDRGEDLSNRIKDLLGGDYVQYTDRDVRLTHHQMTRLLALLADRAA